MKTAVIIFLISCTVSEAQVSQSEAKHTQCCDASVSMTVGALTERVANLMDKMSLMETKMQNTESQLMELKSITLGTPKVAFSAALYDSSSGDTGPFTTATPLKYKKVFSNIGSNYNSATGIFTATVKGMYFFRFSMFNNLQSTPSSVVSLMRNGERVVSVWDTSGSDANDMGSNAAVLPLEVGDTVYAELAANRQVYDDSMNYNTFAGFLLFTM